MAAGVVRDWVTARKLRLPPKLAWIVDGCEKRGIELRLATHELTAFHSTFSFIIGPIEHDSETTKRKIRDLRRAGIIRR